MSGTDQLSNYVQIPYLNSVVPQQQTQPVGSSIGFAGFTGCNKSPANSSTGQHLEHTPRNTY